MSVDSGSVYQNIVYMNLPGINHLRDTNVLVLEFCESQKCLGNEEYYYDKAGSEYQPGFRDLKCRI